MTVLNENCESTDRNACNQQNECQDAKFNMENIEENTINADYFESRTTIISENIQDESCSIQGINSDIDDPDYIVNSSEGNSSSGSNTRQGNFICQTIDNVAVKRRRGIANNKKEMVNIYIISTIPINVT